MVKTSETDVKRLLPGIVKQAQKDGIVGNKLFTSEIRPLFDKYYSPTEEDKEILANRGDDKLSQVIRNISAHQSEKVKEYTEGFILTKPDKEAMFSFEEIDDDNIDTIASNLDEQSIVGNNIIYYGAPGTGKSWRVTQEIKKSYPNFETESSQEAQFVFRTTLHPEYTYSDFIGQILPVTQKDEIKYEFTPGVFTRALEKAISLEQQNQPVYLVLEELSRANVAAVLGDLFQLLDRKDGVSEYSISNPIIAKHIYHAGDEKNQDGSFNIKEQELINKKIYLPKNLFILGTVNTNDQNVFVMDTAFKRRFEWEYVSTKPVSKNGAYLNNPCLDIGGGFLVEWTVFYQKLNLYITKNMMLGEDKQVGQFFLKFDDINDKTANLKQLQNKLLQYLWDDIEKAAFNKTLFDNIDNYADLYEKFGKKQSVFNSEFLDTLSPVDNQETQSTGDYTDGEE